MKLMVEVSEEEVSRTYLASNRLVAIDRDLAEEMAKCDGGVGSHLMIYDAARDRYIRNKSNV